MGPVPKVSGTVSGPAPFCPGQKKDRPHFVRDRFAPGLEQTDYEFKETS